MYVFACAMAQMVSLPPSVRMTEPQL